LCRHEAAALTALQPHLTEAGVALAAVLHEKPPEKAVLEFASYFGGPIYHDVGHHFFGPVERRLGLAGMLRFNLWTRVYAAKQDGVSGNLNGDGSLLGGVYVIGPGDQGILYEHREGDFGDQFNPEKLLQALQLIKQRQ